MSTPPSIPDVSRLGVIAPEEAAVRLEAAVSRTTLLLPIRYFG